VLSPRTQLRDSNTPPAPLKIRPHDRGELGMNPLASRNQGWLHDAGDRATDLCAGAYALGRPDDRLSGSKASASCSMRFRAL
jgi:hypothetical protein